MSRDDIPHKLRERALKTGALALSLAGATARRVFSSKPAADAALGEALLGHLDEMKGMAMKVGQILSYMDGALPEAAQDKLRQLQTGAQPLEFATIGSVIEGELGEARFERLDPDAIAAASIGQVHRGRVAGLEVAVKVQYPHVEETLEGDMGTLHKIAGLTTLATAVDGAAIVQELHDRLIEECDYQHEAHWQEQFAQWFAADADIVVPRVLRSHSSHRVLTTAWCEGQSFYDFCSRAPALQRERAAQSLLRFTWSSFLHHRAIQADPHPGNYVFLPEGKVAFLDFGCVRVFDEPFWRASVEQLAAVLTGDKARHDVAVRALGLAQHPRFDFEQWWELMRWQYRPYCGEHFEFTSSYVQEMRRFNGLHNGRAMARVSLPAQSIWMLRLITGLHAVLARLGANGDFRTPLRDWLQQAGAQC
jgi:predicted unusual protein kinase regulating ubiquinone biosynthesis (AarF/ABC1/UbiB family)